MRAAEVDTHRLRLESELRVHVQRFIGRLVVDGITQHNDVVHRDILVGCAVGLRLGFRLLLRLFHLAEQVLPFLGLAKLEIYRRLLDVRNGLRFDRGTHRWRRGRIQIEILRQRRVVVEAHVFDCAFRCLFLTFGFVILDEELQRTGVRGRVGLLCRLRLRLLLHVFIENPPLDARVFYTYVGAGEFIESLQQRRALLGGNRFGRRVGLEFDRFIGLQLGELRFRFAFEGCLGLGF